jgi:hypothetical protein
MKNLLNTYFIIALITVTSYSQVGIGTTTPQAALDIVSTDKGLLIPRVSLTNLNAPSISAVVAYSTMVFNTNNATGIGYYYWDNTEWISIGGSSSSTDSWTEDGNAISNYVNNAYTGTNASAQLGDIRDQNFGTNDPDWQFNGDFERLGTTNNRPLFLTQDNEPNFLIANKRIFAMSRGNTNSPAYTFYDAPNTGMSAITRWTNNASGKGRTFDGSSSSTLNRSELQFSVDGNNIITLDDSETIINNKLRINDVLKLVDDTDFTPTGGGSTSGQNGDIRRKGDNLFMKTSSGWMKFRLVTP